MVCNRCILVVKQELNKLNIEGSDVSLGEVHVANEISQEQLQRLGNNLAAHGFEVIDNRTSSVIEKIKTLIIKKARNDVDEKYKRMKLSNYLSEHRCG